LSLAVTTVKVNRRQSYLSLLAMAGNISLNFAVNLVVGLYLGRTVDEWLDCRPWATAFGAFLGFAAGLWSVYKLVRKGMISNR